MELNGDEMNRSSPGSSRISLSQDEMRKLGYRVVDLLAEHFANMERGPVGAKADPARVIPFSIAIFPKRGVIQRSFLRNSSAKFFQTTCMSIIPVSSPSFPVRIIL
jgi:hypothetical protein